MENIIAEEIARMEEAGSPSELQAAEPKIQNDAVPRETFFDAKDIDELELVTANPKGEPYGTIFMTTAGKDIHADQWLRDRLTESAPEDKVPLEVQAIVDSLPVPSTVAETTASTVALPRAKLKDKMEVVIQYGSELTPGNVVLLGTGDINKKYRQWLENRFQQGLTQNDPEKKPSKERVTLYRLVHALCYMAVVEDETEVVTYTWKGPKFYRKHQDLDITKVVQEFVKEKQDILYSIAPFFGVKTNRKAAIDSINQEKVNA